MPSFNLQPIDWDKVYGKKSDSNITGSAKPAPSTVKDLAKSALDNPIDWSKIYPPKTDAKTAQESHAYNPANPDYQKNLDAITGNTKPGIINNLGAGAKDALKFTAKTALELPKQTLYDPFAHPSDYTKTLENQIGGPTGNKVTDLLTSAPRFLARTAVRGLSPIGEGLGTQIAEIKFTREEANAVAKNKDFQTIGKQVMPVEFQSKQGKITPEEYVHTVMNSANIGFAIGGLLTDFAKSTADQLATSSSKTILSPTQLQEFSRRPLVDENGKPLTGDERFVAQRFQQVAKSIGDEGRSLTLERATDPNTLAGKIAKKLGGENQAPALHGSIGGSPLEGPVADTVTDVVPYEGGSRQAPTLREQLGVDVSSLGGPKEAPIIPMHEQLGLTAASDGNIGAPAQAPTLREQLMANQAPTIDPQVQKYNDIVQQKYGTDSVISADDAKETYPDYNGTNSDKFQKLGSDFAMKRYQELLDTRQGQGNNAVLFLTGGTGAGKTTALKRGVSNFKEYPIIYELNGQHLPGMQKVIQLALDKGFKVEQVHVHTDPSTSYDRVINRVGEEGRVVSVDNHITRHEGSFNNLPAIKEHFGDHVQQFGLVNNDVPTISTIDKLEKYKYNELKDQLHDKLNKAESEGRLTKEQAAKSRGSSLGQQKSETNSSTPSKRTSGSEQGVRSQSESLDETKKEDTSVTLQGGIPGVSEFIEQDIKPGTKAFVKNAIQVFRDARNLIAPRMGVDRASLDAFMKMKGERDKAEFIMQRTLKTAEAMFDHLSQKAQIEFFDNYKKGLPQASKELQAYADFRRDFDKMIYDEIQAIKPNAAWIDDHMRVLWKKIPGSTEGTREQIFGSKKPLQGSKGFLKQHTLPDMTAGLKMGGIPYTYNPARMDNLAWSDSIRYVSAQKLWKALGESGSKQYLAAGKSVPLGKALVNDQIANIFFGGGRWVLDSGDARLLNNMLSTDYIRKSAGGRTALIVKNIYTSVELSLSTFHAIFVTADTIASRLSLGILKIFNLGIKNGLAGIYHANPSEIKASIKAFADGTKDILSTPYSPISSTRQGVAGTRSLTGKPNIMEGKDLEIAKEEFKQSRLGKMLYKQYENYPELVDLLFDGGLKPKMDVAYRTNTIDSFTAAIKQGNFIGGALRAVPALNQTIMTPLFEWYIPALKWGVSLKALSYELELNADRIANGKISKEEVARNVVNRTENRLGEMNFDNLFWNNTFKTSMQLLFRSITWLGGSIREIGLAPIEQAREFYSAFKEKRAPNMTPKIAYIFALLVLTAVIAETIQYLSTGKHINPFSKDIAYPKVNEDGDRVTVPTYIKDVFAFKQDPVQTVKNKLSGLWGKVAEDLSNKDFYSNEIYKESDPAWLKFTKAMWHLKPMPFSVQSALNQPTTAGKIQSFAGITKAPRYVDNTPMQNDIYALYNQRFGGGTKSELQTKKADTSKKYKDLLKAGKTGEAQAVKAQAISDGTYTERGFGRIETNLKKGTDKVLFDRLPQDDKDRLMKKMTDEEKAYYSTKSSSGGVSRGGGRGGGR